MKFHSVQDILPLIPVPYRLSGDPEGRSFSMLRATLDGDESSLVFIAKGRKDTQELAEKTQAGIIICDDSVDFSKESLAGKLFIIVEDPKFVFARIGNRLFMQKPAPSIHPSAVIHPGAEIHPDTYIGPFCYIGRCSIGEGTVIHGNCHIHDNTRIGRNVLINAGCVIGAEGMGHIRNEQGLYENFPHLGGVLIGDDVEIGPNSCVSRGALKDTVIRKNAKIDCQVQIGHNADIGENSIIIANSVIGGSSRVGANAWIGIGASIADMVQIGDNAVVGGASLVISSVPDNATAAVRPAVLLPLTKLSTSA